MLCEPIRRGTETNSPIVEKNDIYIHYTCSLFVKCMSCFLRTTCAQARINPGTNVDIVRIVPMSLLSFRQFINGDK